MKDTDSLRGLERGMTEPAVAVVLDGSPLFEQATGSFVKDTDSLRGFVRGMTEPDVLDTGRL